MNKAAPTSATRIIALCGGVGGAKLAFGLARLSGPELSVIINTGDDFEHLGLRISPDIDSVLYKLAGLNDAQRGWGRADETWSFMDALEGLGGETWFKLGDKDLAIHVERTRRLRRGETLTACTAEFARRFGLSARLSPMSDEAIRTKVATAEGVLAFQRYFVENRCEPAVTGVIYEGADKARLSSEARIAFASPQLEAVVICPSNPYLSIGPMLALAELRRALEQTSAPVVAVSPLIGGAAIKGPAAKLMNELGVSSTNHAIADFYGLLIDGLVIDETDAADAASIATPTFVCNTLMRTNDDSERLAHSVVEFAKTLADARRKEIRDAARV